MTNGSRINGHRSDLVQLFDGSGNVVTEFHPRFNDVKREIAFGYNDAPERRGQAPPITSSESWVKNRDRITAMADARDQAQFSWVGGMIGRVCRYVVGRLHCKSETGDEQIDSMYDDYFHRWSGEERNEDGTTSCDITGRHRFLKMVQMAFVAHIVDGDYGFLEVAPEFSPSGGYCLQGIEADRIGSPLEGVQSEDYIGGVKIDTATGRVLYYRIFNRSRTQQYTKLGEIEPANFIHLHDFERSDEYRGRTKLLRALNDLRDIREALTAEMISAKVQSQFAAMVGVKDPFNGQGAAAWSGKTASGTPTQDALYGKILKMSEGEQFSMMAPAARPSGAFMNLIDTLIRKLAISLELSYGLVWNLATLGGASQRIETEADNLKIQTWQDLLKDYVLTRVRTKVISQGIANRELPPHPNWRKCSWNFGKQITADLGYEMESDIKGVQMGILELEKVVPKHTGKSATEVNKSNLSVANAFINNSATAGIPVETVAKGLFPMITQERAAFLQSQMPPQPPPSPVSIGVLGDKGIKPLVDIMEKVGNGTIDRESAINAIIEIYSQPDNPLSRQDAEKLVPEEPEEEQLNRNAGLTPEGKHAPVVAGPKTAGSNGSKPKTNGAAK